MPPKATDGSGKSKLNLKKLSPRGGIYTSLVDVKGRIVPSAIEVLWLAEALAAGSDAAAGATSMPASARDDAPATMLDFSKSRRVSRFFIVGSPIGPGW